MMLGDIGNLAHRFAKANNNYFVNFNENEDSSSIIYLDADNLYGWTLIQPLPAGNLSYVHSSKFKINNYVDKGAIIECDPVFIKHISFNC